MPVLFPAPARPTKIPQVLAKRQDAVLLAWPPNKFCVSKMARGNQRDKAREKNQKRLAAAQKGRSDDGMTPEQRNMRWGAEQTCAHGRTRCTFALALPTAMAQLSNYECSILHAATSDKQKLLDKKAAKDVRIN